MMFIQIKIDLITKSAKAEDRLRNQGQSQADKKLSLSE